MSPETRIVLSHFSEADPKTWRWPNFSPAEIACRGTGKAALEIGVDTACKAEKRREGESEEFSMHWRLPFCVFDLVKQSPARRG